MTTVQNAAAFGSTEESSTSSYRDRLATKRVVTTTRDRGYSEDRRSDHSDRREYRDDDHHRSHDSHQGKHKKESFLGDIFDF